MSRMVSEMNNVNELFHQNMTEFLQTDIDGCRNAILKRDANAHHARVSVGNSGLWENFFVYFNIVCSQSKSKSSLLLLILSNEPIARKSFDSPRLKLTKLDNFQHTLKYNKR
jgi:hypothetical protein